MIRTRIFWGSILGSPYFGKLPNLDQAIGESLADRLEGSAEPAEEADRKQPLSSAE